MKFLVDECVGGAVADHLVNTGHDAVFVGDHRPGTGDPDVLTWAVAERRVLVTLDRGFGALIVRDGGAHRGVILLRIGNRPPRERINAVERALAAVPDPADKMVVVSRDAVRVSQR